MEWNPEQDEKYFAQYLDNYTEDDNTQLKNQIKEKLVNNIYLAKALDNKNLEYRLNKKSDILEINPEEYFGINILPYLLVPPTQTEVANYVCFETRSVRSSSFNRNYNKAIKVQQIIFQIMCQEQNKDVEGLYDGAICSYGVARHDLIAAILKHEFNYYPFKGGKAVLVQDNSGSTDTNYAMRELTYEFMTDGELAKTVNGSKYMVNKLYVPDEKTN